MASEVGESDSSTSGLASQMVGRVLRGTYRVLDVLDEGGMGVVFVAEHVRLHRRVAIKVLAGHMAQNQQALARFQQEAEVISQLHHPHIVNVTDFDRTEAGEPYLVMELLQGRTLQSRMEAPLTAEEAVSITVQVASALASAHQAGVVHRDLKPANVFLLEMPGQGPFVKLLDFGISKLSSAARGLTGQFDVIGTPEYMSPEQACGRTALVDQRGDQYSLAVLAFEMLTGRVPFEASDIGQLLRRVISDPPPPLSELRPDLPAELGGTVQRALSKDPEDRYPTISEFADALVAAFGQVGTRSRPPISRSDPPLQHSSRPRTDPAARTSLAPDSTAYAVTPEDRPSTIRRRRASAQAATGVRTSSSNPPAVSEVAPRACRELGADALRQRVAVEETALAAASLSAKEAFLLSRIESGSILEDVLDLSPLPREETLEILVRLLERGLISTAA